MSELLQVTGSVQIILSGWDGIGRPHADVTVGDIRNWLGAIERYGVSDDAVVNECVLSMHVQGWNVIPIECAEHDGVAPKDALVVLHECS